jgi:SSS family solute:Na+ symporter
MTNVTWYQIGPLPLFYLVCRNDLVPKFMPVRSKEAKAWIIAGCSNGQAFMGVILGMLAKVATKACLTVLHAASMDGEWDYLYVTWLIWFHLILAILSTADSCLMAASGNIVTDIIAKFSKKVNA